MTMTIGSAAAGAREKLQGLREMLVQFLLALDDVPEPDNEPAIVESLRATAVEIEQELGDALSEWALLRVTRRLHDELASPDVIAEIIRIGIERGGTWRRWSDVVLRALDESKHQHYDALDALAGSFSEHTARI